MKRLIGISAVALLALAGCSKKTDTAASAGGAASPATATASAPEARSAGPAAIPTRKSGLWEQTLSSDKMHQTTRMCLDDTTEQKMKWWATENRGSAKSDCEEQKISPKLGGGWTFHSVCDIGAGKVTSTGEVTGDFGSHYVMNITSVTSGSAMAQANGEHKMTMEGTWKGACPADMRPGDIEMPGGMKINTLDMAAGKSPLAGMGAGGHMSSADIARLRAQAREMAKAAREEK
jgi:hypothetical protein